MTASFSVNSGLVLFSHILAAEANIPLIRSFNSGACSSEMDDLEMGVR